MSNPRIVIRGADYEHTLAVPGTYEGFQFGYETMRPQAIFVPMLESRCFEVCEFSLANYIMVVADTAEIAEDARESIATEYRDLPAASTFDDAVQPGAPQLHEGISGNLAFEFDSGDAQAVEAAFGRAKYVSRLTVDSQRVVGNALEPRAGLVQYDAATDRYHFHIPLQGVGGMKGQIAAVTGLNKDQIVLVAQDVGGSFGVRGAVYPEYFAMMLAARKLGRPVKWTSSRAETFMTHWKAGRLQLIAQAGAKRIGSMPELPTIAESGVPGYEAIIWYGFMRTVWFATLSFFWKRQSQRTPGAS